MSPAQSTARLILYVAAAVLAVLATDIDAMAEAGAHQWLTLAIKAALAGVIAARAYIDKSPAEISKP